MTVAGANQCRYPTEFDLDKKKKHFFFFYFKKSPIKKNKKCLDFFFLCFFFTVSLLLYLECVPLSLYFFFISSPRFSHFSSSPPSGGIPRSLQEADCADLDSKLLICSADVKRGNVHNGQARGLLRSVLHHCLAPLSRVFLCSGEEKKERKTEKKGRRQLLDDLATCWEIAEKKKTNSPGSAAGDG